MTGLVILTFIPLLAAVFFFIRTRDEQKRRGRAEERLAQIERAGAATPGHAEWNAVLGHELRSPIAAILGYEELIEEGTFGELPAAAHDSLQRIGRAARQLLLLVEAVERTRGAADHLDEIRPITAAELCRDAIDAVSFEAESRGTSIHPAPAEITLLTRPAEATRALTLLLGAAIKASPGATLHLDVRAAETTEIVLAGTSLDPDRDTLAPDRPLTAPALRLELARTMAAAVSGSLHLEEAGVVRLVLPSLRLQRD